MEANLSIFCQGQLVEVSLNVRALGMGMGQRNVICRLESLGLVNHHGTSVR
jgi:hypothetical protein